MNVINTILFWPIILIVFLVWLCIAIPVVVMAE